MPLESDRLAGDIHQWLKGRVANFKVLRGGESAYTGIACFAPTFVLRYRICGPHSEECSWQDFKEGLESTPCQSETLRNRTGRGIHHS